ncbi:glycine--tRNA ligase [candidate division KSB3 bacterium]|uniref:Glycine--tRNA ligase n=1 Tax=candidate division KSB3 bacterium TaxID=2044937 RepID=A0A2G6E392_9BACT|nr:MAG: glycine--tRNA ligase [candidate division KSB3 bacterium]PIE28744.1 MAG: glycine--tRNA ligase [candidate division KSB3 bacterium]
MEKIVSLCKRRGFIFQSSEIYGGLNSCWDYGPLGVELKRNVKDAWWRSVVYERSDIYGLDASILMHPEVWRASGHIEGFSDPLVDCKKCKHRFRQDHLEDRSICPDCGGELTEARQFNLMFKTFMGPVENSASTVYMRPETAQGIFVNFQNVIKSSRAKVPFGIAQIGKAFRNEITPGNFTFRTREFEQMEIEFFVKPGEDETWLHYWKDQRFNWYISYGIKKENLMLRQHEADELAHYAKECYDVEYQFPFGWSELEGIASRTDFDLTQHQTFSTKNMSYFDEARQERYIPYVIEPSAGADRSTLAFLVDAYDEEEERVVLRFHPKLAPVKAAVFPLMRKEGHPEKAREIEKILRPHFKVQYDESGNIGRRYRRQDEIGTPYCVTVDHDTFQDDSVTLRDRDSMEQVRVPIAGLIDILQEKINA